MVQTSEDPESRDLDGDGDGGEGEEVAGEEVGLVAAVMVAVLPALHQDPTKEILVLAAAGVVRLQ